MYIVRVLVHVIVIDGLGLMESPITITSTATLSTSTTFYYLCKPQ
jgi:hypothetical protein